MKDFLARLTDDEAAAVAAAMRDVKLNGNVSAHHLRGEIYEVIAASSNKAFRILYATDGRHDQVVLALHGITKKTRTVPDKEIRLAETRLRAWRARAREPRC